jgi:hypothetical protein
MKYGEPVENTYGNVMRSVERAMQVLEAEEREQIGLETENQGPIGLLVSILRERGEGGRY